MTSIEFKNRLVVREAQIIKSFGQIPFSECKLHISHDIHTATIRDSYNLLPYCRYSLLRQCVQNNEPSIIIGDTGIGKTTACQLLAESRSQRLHILNCNRNTETSDFVGGYRPNKSKELHYRNALTLLEEINASIGSNMKISSLSDLNQVLPELRALIENRDLENNHRNILLRLQESISNFFAPFEWVDGPLVTAMKNGDLLLIDELNLAEDAVLERLNRYVDFIRHEF